MKVLVTGASGFLGRQVLAALRRQGIACCAIGRRQVVEPLSGDIPSVDLLEEPDLESIVRNAQCTHMIHMAWYAEHGKFWSSPLNLQWVHATTRLVNAFCSAGGRRVVVAGSCAEYDWSYGYCREAHTPLQPATLYGVAKDATRRLIAAQCRASGVGYAWGRVFLPYGAGDASPRLLPSLIRYFQGRTAAFGVNSQAFRDFIHVSDVAAAFVALLNDDAEGEYNISSGEPVGLRSLVIELASRMGADPSPVLELSGARPGEPVMLVGDNERLRALGWKPSIALDQGLTECAGGNLG